MRFVDQDEIEADLPGDWDARVQLAWRYVDNKVNEAEQSTLEKAEEKGWTGEELQEKIHEAKVKARKVAISYKALWSDLSDLLSEQTKGKCWYCETNECRSDNPIDHFRPKNKVAECDDHRGYWWLAFDWKNYRFSCTFCNSRRVDVDTAGGKQDHFPIFLPPDWNKCEADSNVERPVLLDPFEEDDCKLITFNDNGEARPVVSDEKSEEYTKAYTSIELYHLNHKPTTRARRTIFQKIRASVATTNELLDQGVVDGRINAIKTTRRELIRLIRHDCKSTRFNTAARIYLKRFEGENAWVKDILDRQ